MQTPPDKQAPPPANRLSRFSDRAGDYARFRPSYPPQAIDAILNGLGDPSGLTCLDVGAGTGISSRLLGDRGCRVIAIEPNAAMRAAAEPHPRVEVREGTSEATGMADRSVDLVLAAQAYHWFDEPVALREFARVLRPGGRIALMWNETDDKDPGGKGYREILSRYATEPPTSPWNNFCIPAIKGHPLYEGYRELGLPYAQPLTIEGLIGRAASSSYVPRNGRAREAMEAELGAMYQQLAHGGVFSLRYITRLYLAERATR